jgi:Short C-terminal domain
MVTATTVTATPEAVRTWRSGEDAATVRQASQRCQMASSAAEPEQILDERLARGEIDSEEYTRVRNLAEDRAQRRRGVVRRSQR